MGLIEFFYMYIATKTWPCVAWSDLFGREREKNRMRKLEVSRKSEIGPTRKVLNDTKCRRAIVYSVSFTRVSA